MDLKAYVTELNRQYQTGIAREHSYRPALQQLFATLLPDLVVTNEPSRVACGAPDFIFSKAPDGMPVAFAEAKDINDGDLDGKHQHEEQFTRYKTSLVRVVFTDYLDFHFYENGKWVENIRIAETRGNKICPVKENMERFDARLHQWANSMPQRITSTGKLAEAMAAKSRLLADAIRKAFEEQEADSYDNRQLQGQYEAFQNVLIHDITPTAFADIYAQTIAYGMFAARLHDETPETFSRQEAATLIPHTNPFLRKVFQSIAGYDLDCRIAWIVDDLATTFRATDVRHIMQEYGHGGMRHDPLIHFYEDFLSYYDPKLRKAKGVWYTPQPIVSFIIRAVDSILQSNFGLPLGLADYSTVEREIKNEQYAKGRKGEKATYKQRFHRVQILDPATGTGTFLAETVNQIYGKFQDMQGIWQSYVEDNLLPRLNGFEILMASYAVAHLKIDLELQETGYAHRKDSRLRVYLANSLEECHPDTGSLFAQWLSNEANEANRIKRDSPVMVMVGNPPYNGESTNKGEWIMHLMESYKKEPGGKEQLKERNPKWLNDDYVKFIRMAQEYIERNGEGIIAFITPHGYLDNPTFRGMRWNLLKTFDKIYVTNLHGNSKKHETCPDGGKDENVFDIMQGTSISIFVKTGKKKVSTFGKVYYHDLFGLRHEKYDFLDSTTFDSINYQELKPKAPMYFFVPKDLRLEKEYLSGFGLNELFVINSVGIVTTKDSFLICDTKNQVKTRINDIINLSTEELRAKYNLKDTRDWSIDRAKADIGSVFEDEKVIPINYRPFDTKFLYYTGLTNGIVARPRFHSMRHLLIPANLGLLSCRQSATNEWNLVGITQSPLKNDGQAVNEERGLVDDCRVSNKTKERGYIFPLYINTGEAGPIFEKDGITPETLTPNFRPDILHKIEKGLDEKIIPLELFDYIYALLHSPSYRERYKEFLKIDFPRIPYPDNAKEYHRLASLGTALRHAHLLDETTVSRWKLSTTYPEPGENQVETLRYADGKVYVNRTQYFGNVPPGVWNTKIGGYQPAQKWLKDRKGRTLSFDDIQHYRCIIHALTETRRLTAEIDSPITQAPN